MKILFLILLLTIRPFGRVAHAAGELSMDNYLDQVRGINGGYVGSDQNASGAKGREFEADLVTAVNLTGKAEYKRDQSIPLTPIISYDSLDTTTYSLGFSKITNFGLNAKITYDITDQNYVNSNIVQFGGAPEMIQAGPTISLTQSLWQNGLGSLTRATIDAKRTQAQADFFNSLATLDSTIQNAMTAYWTLVLQREVVAIRKLAVDQAQAVLDYDSKRAKMNLGEEADVLTARASVEARQLDLQSAIDDEATDRRLFNQYRNRPPMEDPGQLTVVKWEWLQQYRLPANRHDRSDVRYAEYQAQYNSANSRIQAESDKPVFEAYGMYTHNGLANDSIGASISNGYQTNKPVTTVGLRLSMPLALDAVKRAKEGAEIQAQAAQTIYQQKLRDQSADWADIEAKVEATKRRVALAQTIEEAQRMKLDYEKRRLKNGRTSTYQVLLFEQDYTASRIARLQTASDMIALVSRARLYVSTEGSGK